MVAELVAILRQAQEMDAEVDRVNGAAPSGEPRRPREQPNGVAAAPTARHEHIRAHAVRPLLL